MATHTIESRYVVTDQTTRPMQNIERSTESATRANENFVDSYGRLRNAQGQYVSSSSGVVSANRSLSSSVNNMATSIGSYALSFIGLGAAINGAIGFMKESISIFTEQEIASQRLTTIMTTVTGATMSQVDAVKELSDELQTLTVIGDEVTEAGLSQLASYGLQAEQLKELAPAFLDLLVAQSGVNASQQDAINVANQLGKVYAGQAGALKRSGVIMTDTQKDIIDEFAKTGNTAGATSELIKVLDSNYKGLSQTMRQTSSGSLQAINNDLGDIQEELGEKLIPAVIDWAEAQREIRAALVDSESAINLIRIAMKEASKTVVGLADAINDINAIIKAGNTIVGNAVQGYKEFKGGLDGISEKIVAINEAYFSLLGESALQALSPKKQLGAIAEALGFVADKAREQNVEIEESNELHDMLKGKLQAGIPILQGWIDKYNESTEVVVKSQKELDKEAKAREKAAAAWLKDFNARLKLAGDLQKMEEEGLDEEGDFKEREQRRKGWSEFQKEQRSEDAKRQMEIDRKSAAALKEIADDELEYIRQVEQKKAEIRATFANAGIMTFSAFTSARIAQIKKESKTEEEAQKKARGYLIANRAVAVAQTIYSTAEGVANALTIKPAELAGPAAIAAGALGGAQLATILSTPLPKLATGASVRGSAGGTPVIVGENGYSEEIFGMGPRGMPRRRGFANEVAQIVNNDRSQNFSPSVSVTVQTMATDTDGLQDAVRDAVVSGIQAGKYETEVFAGGN